MRRCNAPEGIVRLCLSTGRAAPPGMPRRQRNAPVTRRDGLPARRNTAALSSARYPLFGRISKSHGIAPTTSYIGTLKVLQPPFMSALTPSRLLSTFRTRFYRFSKNRVLTAGSSAPCGEADMGDLGVQWPIDSKKGMATCPTMV